MQTRHIPLAIGLFLTLLSSSLLVPIPRATAQFEFLIARVKPAVVLVSVKHVLGGDGQGSGFIYDSSGFILTNHHVVEGATEITVTLSDKRSFPASVVDYIRKEEYAGAEFQTAIDVAVLKIDASELPTLSLGDSNLLRQGQEILVLGYPSGVGTEEVSVTRGIVSALRLGWIQTDASIVPGNSGGPVVDRLGRVVGLATFVTGPSARFARIGGVVAVNGLKDVASASMNAAAPRYQVLSVTGMEYVPTVKVGRSVRWRFTYYPGKTGGQFSSSEFSYEVADVRNLNGAVVYTLRYSNGGTAQNYLDSQGLFQIAVSVPNWTRLSSEPLIILLFPPFVGRSWQNRLQEENASQGVRRKDMDDVRVETANEMVSTPAGSFTAPIKLVTRSQRIVVQGNQPRTYNSMFTVWEVPGVGSVRSVREVFETEERIVEELVGISY